MRVTSQSRDDALVILPGEALELRVVDRQVNASTIKAPVAPAALPDQQGRRNISVGETIRVLPLAGQSIG